MRPHCFKGWIIGLGLLLLSGCSAVRLGYNTGPQLAWWWLDGYVDFSGAQSPRVKDALGQWFAWHRSTQLDATAAFLAGLAAQVEQPVAPATACRVFEQARTLLAPSVAQAVLLAADEVPALGEVQFKHMEQQFARKNADMRDEFMAPKPERRLKDSLQRAVERAESLYGDLDEAQRRVLAAGMAASPFDPERWLAERQRRQQDTLATLRTLVAERADRSRTSSALTALIDRMELSPDPAYRAYQQRLTDFNCTLAAQLHNATTPAQRLVARRKLKGWEEDARALMVSPQALRTVPAEPTPRLASTPEPRPSRQG